MKLNIHIEEPEVKAVHESELSAPLLLTLTVTGMILLGLCMLYSTSSGLEKIGQKFFFKQLTWAILGAVVAVGICFVGYKKLLKYSIIILPVALLGLVLALMSPEINGARRWIRLPGFSLQPSEFAKLALLLYVSSFLAKRQRAVNSFEGILPLLCWIGATLSLIILGEDLGTTLLLTGSVLTIFFIAGMRLRWFGLVGLSIPTLILIIKNFDAMRWGRLTSFLDPEAVHKANGYQLWNSLLALGSGNWIGLGFTKSRMKAMYLPEAHTDFIVSIIGEELGFVSIIILIILYLLILFSGVKIAASSKDKAGLFLGSGITFMICAQAIINLGVVSGAFPTKGMPAPFISYGGSNMLSCLCGIGLLLSIHLENQKQALE
jgi:cell division protein FtsW